MLVFPIPLRGVVTRRIGGAVAAAGGALILVEALSLTAYADPYWTGFAVVAGAAILGCGIAGLRYWGNPQLLGGSALVLSVISFFGINGYIFGSFLGSLGGTLLLLAPGIASTRASRKAAFSARDLGPPCRSCGQHVPPWTSKCPYCGFTN